MAKDPGSSAAAHTAAQITISVLRRQWRLVLLCTALLPLTVLVFSLAQEQRYTASAFLLFRDPALDERLFGTSFFPAAEDPAREAATNVRLVSLSVVAERTAAAVDTPGIDGATVSNVVSVSEEGESDIIEVEAESENPELAADLANAFANQYIEFRKDADRARIREAQSLIDAQVQALPEAQRLGPEGEQLRQRSQELEVLASLQTGNAELVEQAAVPNAASSPKTKRNVVLGLLAGMMLGGALAFLREQVDRRLRSASEAQQLYQRPILASIPQAASMMGSNAIRLHQPPDAASEAFRMLRTNLRYFNIDRKLDSILVTSAAPQDGKTTVSWNLALAEAESGKRVLLIEADLRRPTLADVMGVDNDRGLSLVVTGAQELSDAVRTIVMPESSASGSSQLDVLIAGPPPPNPTELIESERMQTLLRETRGYYDLVVVDTPPAGHVADAIPLMNRVSGVIVVARVDQSDQRDIVTLRDELEQLEAPVLGIVVNGATSPESYYYRARH